MSGLAAALVIALTGAQVPAPPAKTAEPPTARPTAQNPNAPPAPPYRKLFTQPQESTARDRVPQALHEAQQALETREPKVVCHMKVIPVDPRIDPKIIIPSRQEPGQTFHIKRIPAPCSE